MHSLLPFHRPLTRVKRPVNVLNNDKLKVDFKPLFECIHIYDTMGLLEELRNSYQADRKVFLLTCVVVVMFLLSVLGPIGSDSANTFTSFVVTRIYPRDHRIFHH